MHPIPPKTQGHSPISAAPVQHTQNTESSSKPKGVFSGRTLKNISSKMAAPFKAMKSALKFSWDVGKGIGSMAKTLYDSSKPDPYWDNL